MTAAADLIKQARVLSGSTQASMAANAGVSQQAISAYETGKKEPSLPTLHKLIKATGLEMRIDLVQGDPGTPTSPSAKTDEIAALRQRIADQGRINWLRGR